LTLLCTLLQDQRGSIQIFWIQILIKNRMPIKLYYFDIFARAEPIRLLLHHAKANWQDVRIGGEELKKLKASGNLEFNQLPAVEIDGRYYVQSRSILRYLSQKFGYYPSDPEEAYKVESISDHWDDLNKNISLATFERDPVKKEELQKSLIEKHYPADLAAVEKRLKANTSQEFLVGNKYTMADFLWINTGYSTILNPHNRDKHAPVLKSFPAYKNYLDVRGKDFEDYLKKRKDSPY